MTKPTIHDLLVSLGMTADPDPLPWRHHFEVRHPEDERFYLKGVLSEGRLDLATMYGSGPQNMPGDPLNICVSTLAHDLDVVQIVAAGVISHFKALSLSS